MGKVKGRDALLVMATVSLPSFSCDGVQHYDWQQHSTFKIDGMKNSAAYDKYVAAQHKKFDKRDDAQSLDWKEEWKKYEGALHKFGGVSQDSMQEVAKFINGNLPLVHKFGLCHGTNRGFEMAYLRKFLPGVDVWGTELAPKLAKLSNWTINWDFHVVKPEWRGRTDFVYSNALDHSPNPPLAVTRWMEEVAPGGALIIEWSRFHERRVHSSTDPYGASFGQVYRMLQQAGETAQSGSQPTGRFHVSTTFNNSATHSKKSWAYRQWFVVQRFS